MIRRIRLTLLVVSLGLAVGLGAAVAFGQAAGAAKPATFKLNEKVEVREGDEWSPVTIVKKEGRKYQIRYEDGTEEWVAPDRLRAAGTTTPAAPAVAGKKPSSGKTTAKTGSGKTAKPAPKEGDAGAAKPNKDVFAIGAKVEVKQASSWNKAKIKNKDGDLYLVIVDGWEAQFHWQWVHAVAIRKIGSDKPGPKWSHTVGIHNSSIEEAKQEAKAKFANIEAEVAAELAGAKDDPFAPIPYDKEITEIDIDGAEDMLPAAPAGKLEAFDAIDAKVKLAARPIPLKAAGASNVLMGGTRGLAVHTTGNGGDMRTVKVELLDLAAGKNTGAVTFDPLSYPIAISPTGAHVLGRAHGFFGNTRARVDLFAVSAGAEPKHQISFKPFAGEKQTDVEWAAFADEDHVLTCNNEGKVIMWDAPKAKAVWQMATRAGSYPALSPNRKQLAVLTSGDLVVLDALKGEGICSVPGSRPATSLAFTPDGKRVFGSTGTTLVYWDLATGELAPDIGLPVKGAGTAGGAPAAADGRFVLVGGRDLLDLDTKAVVWRYEPAAGSPAPGAWGGPPAALSHGGRCWALVSEGNKSILTSAALPHKSARAAADKAAPEQLLLVKPGSSVSLMVTIEGPEDQRKRIQDSITAQLAAHNIKVDNLSLIRLIVKTENGKTEQRQYQGFGLGGSATVNVTEKISRIYFEENGKIAWEARTVANASMMVNAKQGQTIEQAVVESNKPNLEFLATAQIPAFVPKATDTPWLGVSKWTMNGVADDPAAAALKPAPVEGDGLR